MKTQATGYWTFFCNPAKWQIDEFLERKHEYDIYQVTPWQQAYFTPGQLGIIRVGVDKRTKKQRGLKPPLQPGIYAIVQVLSRAQKRELVTEATDYWLDPAEINMENPVVHIRYVRNLLHTPLLLQQLRANPQIQDAYIIPGFQASTMPLAPETFQEILRLCEHGTGELDNIEVETIDTYQAIRDLEQKYANAVPEVKAALSRQVERGPLAQAVKDLTGRKCLLCEAMNWPVHSFRKRNGEYYVEAHHVIPVSLEKQGTLSVTNILTVCANHHRQLHYGNAEVLHHHEHEFLVTIDGQSHIIKKIQIPKSLQDGAE